MKNKTIFKKVLGVWLAYNVFGNCFAPAICLNTSKGKPFVSNGKKCYPAKVTLTLRFKGLETTIFWRGAMRLDWNSAHVARYLGKSFEAPHGLCWQYDGLLGHHMDI